MNRPILARTPADFWRRYNCPAHQYFREDIFRPLAARGRPIVGILAGFLVSGIVHEYLFWAASGRARGYQMAFFLVQGLAAALTARVALSGDRAILGILGTLAFNLVCSTLFFLSMNEVFPFYVSRAGKSP
jgi:D-alanyl-lipoteichoic acid acyltransferase DltB (MBOAT superfamily)